jgi:hypothetical protein
MQKFMEQKQKNGEAMEKLDEAERKYALPKDLYMEREKYKEK